MKEKSNEIKRAKEVLSKMDPELAMMAIRQAEVDFDEVDKIKDLLGKYNPEAVQYAVAELQQGVMTKEINKIKDQLKVFTAEVAREAAVELGFGARVGLCLYPIECHGASITIMARCGQDIRYVRSRRDEIVNPEMIEGIVNRAVLRALKAK